MLEIILLSKMCSPLSIRTFKEELGYEKLYRELFHFVARSLTRKKRKKLHVELRNKSTERIYLPTNIHIRES